MMKVPAAHPQPFSKPLREIARIIAERESDEACVARIIQYLDARGVPLPPRGGNVIAKTGCRV